MIAPISSVFNEQNWLELINTSNKDVKVRIDFYDNAGNSLLSEQTVLGAYEQRHVWVNEVLSAEQSGKAVITPNTSNTIIAQSMFYFRDSTGAVMSMYGSQVSEALKRNVFGSYNLFLDMNNWLRLSNASAQTLEISISVNTATGTLTEDLSLAPNSTRDIPLHDAARFNTSANTYGVVVLQPMNSSGFSAELLRTRELNGAMDFAAPTVLR